MKQETRYKLKRYAKYAYYGVIALCWLMALIGVSAYAIYQCKLLADYQEPKQQEAVKHNASYHNEVKYYQAYSNDYYSTQAFNDGLDSYINTDMTTNYDFFAVYSTDCKVNDIIYPMLELKLRYLEATNVSQVLLMHFDFYIPGNDNDYRMPLRCSVQTSGSGIYTYTYISDTSFAFSFSKLTPVSGITDYVYDIYGLFDYCFKTIYSSYNASAFTIDFNTANFTQLLSYARVGVYDFIYSGVNWGQVLEIPLVFYYDGVLYDSILIETDNIVYYIGTDDNMHIYTDLTKSSTSYIAGATHVAFLKFGGSYDTTYPDGTSSPSYLYPYMIGSITEIAYREVAYYYDYQPSQGSSHMRPVYNMPKGWNTYGNISYTISVSRESLGNIPFPASSSDVHYPLNNMNVESILNYISTSDTFSIGSINGTTDVGLGGVFNLLSGAFSGLTSLMAIQIIPGITLGLLLFMPLVITIIIVILRLVKK